jgi:hypothetical protein
MFLISFNILALVRIENIVALSIYVVEILSYFIMSLIFKMYIVPEFHYKKNSINLFMHKSLYKALITLKHKHTPAEKRSKGLIF